MKKAIYLDYAAASPLDQEVLGVMQPYFSRQFYNPSAMYLAAKRVRKDVEQARANVANVLGARSGEIIFTAGGTEANNLAIGGVMQNFPDKKIVFSSVEHESVLRPAEQFAHAIVKVDSTGLVNLDDLRKKIDSQTVLVSIMYANNEVGTIQPIVKVAKMIKEVRLQRQKTNNNLPLYLHTDACQAANYLPLMVNTLSIDLMTLNGGKIYGPKQSGALYVKTGVKISPIISGGGQENSLRNGTENVPAIIGFSYALQKAQILRVSESKRLRQIQKVFESELSKEMPSAVVNGSENKLPNNVHVTFPGQDNERLVMELDEKGIQCAVGSACSASNEEPSHVLKAMGLSDLAAQSSLRFTMGRDTTEDTVKTVIKILTPLLNQ